MTRDPLSSSNNREMWDRYLPFHLSVGEGYWFNEQMDLPFGLLLLGQSSYCFLNDLNAVPLEEILSLCQAIVFSKGTRALSFIFHPATTGDRRGFESILKARGYENKNQMDWLVVHLEKGQEPLAPFIEKADESDRTTIEAIYHDVFPKDDYGIALLLLLMNQKSSPDFSDSVYLIKHKDTLERIGMVGLAMASLHQGKSIAPYGFIHDLATLKQFQQQGYASRLMRYVMQLAASQGIQALVAAIELQNVASLSFHRKHGYNTFAYTDIWQENIKVFGS